MDINRNTSNTDECLVTALQIFDYCGADTTGTLHVDELMDKCAPSVKTNNAEFSYLKSLLDPNQCNPEISVSKLASALNMFSDSQRSKLDLDESFNLKISSGPQDSDSGISNDGYLILEELQSELREKCHLASQLRDQLEFTDRQHEEAFAAVAAERDSLKAQLVFLRDENASLSHMRRDYEEACERLCGAEQELGSLRRERDDAARRAAALTERLARHAHENQTLQELLTKSKEECHRINEMYASRQSSLLEQNEALRAEHAELAARLQDQDDLVQHMLNEKVVLEMELKDVLNRSNQTQLRLERSVDVSYTEDQMLTALDSLNMDSRFSADNHVLDEEAFLKQLKEEHGRASNLSLFDEIRLSFCNVSRTELPPNLSTSHSQMLDLNDACDRSAQTLDLSRAAIGTQTDTPDDQQCEHHEMCMDYDKLKDKVAKLQFDLKLSNNKVEILKTDQIRYEGNLNVMQKYVEGFNVEATARAMQTELVEKCHDCVEKTVEYDKQKDRNFKLNIDLRKSRLTISNLETKVSKYETNLKMLQQQVDSCNVEKNVIATQTDTVIQTDPSTNNNNVDNCGYCASKCLNCQKLEECGDKLKHEVSEANDKINEMHTVLDKYENTLDNLQRYVDEGIDRNKFLEAISDDLQTKLEILETACQTQKDKFERLTCESCAADCQTDECDVASVSTQAEAACAQCDKRNAVVPHRSFRRLLWESLRSLFQGFAVLCFLCALSVLYGVTRRAVRCHRDAVPWRWLDAQDLVDMLLRIDYVADVPM